LLKLRIPPHRTTLYDSFVILVSPRNFRNTLILNACTHIPYARFSNVKTGFVISKKARKTSYCDSRVESMQKYRVEFRVSCDHPYRALFDMQVQIHKSLW